MKGDFGMKKVETIYWALLGHNQWKFYIGAMDKGLCYVGSWDAPFDELEAWARKRYPGVL